MKKTMKLVSLILAMLMLVACAAACGGGGGGEEKLKVYRNYMGTDCTTLNAHDIADSNLQTPYDYAGACMYRRVPTADGKSYEYIGDLGDGLPVKDASKTTYKTNDKGEQVVDTTTWTLKVRKDAKWHDGTAIDADDLLYSWKMLGDPTLANVMSDFLNYNINILNADEYRNVDPAKPSKTWEEVGLKKIDDYTIELICVGDPAVTDVCGNFNDRSMFVVKQDVYEAGMNADRTNTTWGSDLEHWVQCGPYKLVEWTEDSKQVYEKVEGHWLSDYAKYDKVEIYIVPEMNTRVQMFESGQLDYLSPDANTIEKYIDDPRLKIDSSTSVFHIDINCKRPSNPITDSLNYRRMIYFAMNREVIAKECFGYMQPAGYYISNQAGVQSVEKVPYRDTTYGQGTTDLIKSWSAEGSTSGYNPTKAWDYFQAALAEKNLPADTKIELIMAFDPSETHWKATAEYLQQEFPKIFKGQVTIKIVNYSGVDTTAWKKAQGVDAWDLSPNDWSRGVSRQNPYTAFYYYTDQYSSPPNNYFSDKFNAKYRECQAATNYAEEMKLTKELEEIMLDEVVICPMVQNASYNVYSERIILPVQNYIPGFGWGAMWGDIDLSK